MKVATQVVNDLDFAVGVKDDTISVDSPNLGVSVGSMFSRIATEIPYVVSNSAEVHLSNLLFILSLAVPHVVLFLNKCWCGFSALSAAYSILEDSMFLGVKCHAISRSECG